MKIQIVSPSGFVGVVIHHNIIILVSFLFEYTASNQNMILKTLTNSAVFVYQSAISIGWYRGYR